MKPLLECTPSAADSLCEEEGKQAGELEVVHTSNPSIPELEVVALCEFKHSLVT